MSKTIFKWQKNDIIKHTLDTSNLQELDNIEQRRLGTAISNCMAAMERRFRTSSKYDSEDLLDALPELSQAVGIDYTAPPPHKKEGDKATFFAKPWYKNTLSQFKNAGATGQNALDRQIAFIASALKLTQIESQMLALAARLHLFADWEYLCDSLIQSLASIVEHDISAIIIGCKRTQVQAASLQDSKLKTCNLIHFGTPHNAMLRSNMRSFFAKQLNDEAEMLAHLLKPCTPSDLQIEDFENVMSFMQDARSLLDKLPHDEGCNILLYGPPGTGKTEAAKCLAREIKLAPVFAGNTDQYGGEPSSSERSAHLRLLRNFTSENIPAVLIIDEAEDLFREADDQIRSKQWLNRLIENGKGPHIWIVNDPSQLGEVIVRRMDMVIAFDLPDRTERQNIITKICNDLFEKPQSTLPNYTAQNIADELSNIQASPALLKAALKSNMQIGGDIESAKTILRQLIVASGHDPIEANPPNSYDFKPSLCNANEDLNVITTQLVKWEAARASKKLQRGEGWNMLLSGPPGTGKSAYAAYLAQHLGLDLMAMQAADLLSSYVGEAEQNIKKAVERAGQKLVLLLIDEVDGFLGDRRDMHQSWQVSQINAMLTAMERERARFVATTNLDKKLDQASARRFSLHLRFGELNHKQAAAMFSSYFNIPAPNALNDLHMLTPGDFAQAKKRMRFTGDASAETIVTWLSQASEARSTARPIGFAAAA